MFDVMPLSALAASMSIDRVRATSARDSIPTSCSPCTTGSLRTCSARMRSKAVCTSSSGSAVTACQCIEQLGNIDDDEVLLLVSHTEVLAS